MDDMWEGAPRRLPEPFMVRVQVDWEFHNPFPLPDGHVLSYKKGLAVRVEMLVPASSNDPFGFPFFWGADGKPYPLWLVERHPD